MARASCDSIDEWMNGTLNPDLFVTSSANLASHRFRFPAAMESELQAIPGVDEIQPVRTPRWSSTASP